MAANDLTAARLRELLAYDPLTGEFRWRRARRGTPIGALAGGKTSHGYIHIGVDGRGQHYAHRLAWLYMNGEWPTCEVDHINGDGLNNRWDNLRDVSRAENIQNRRRAHRTSQTGFLGVSRKGSGFTAEISVSGQRRYLGMFKSAQEAHDAYVEAKRAIHPGNTL